jgi:peroxiredoxin
MIERSITRSQVRKTNSEVADADAVEVVAYVKEMTRELAELTNSAGLDKLTNFLIVASLEAQLCYFQSRRAENSLIEFLHRRRRRLACGPKSK